jgi:hypothetical protein
MLVISTDKAPGAIGPYSQGFVTNGFVFTSGQIAINPADGTIPASALSERWRTERTAVNDDEIHINIFKTQRHIFLPYAAGIPTMLNGLKLKTADGKTAIFTMEQK